MSFGTILTIAEKKGFAIVQACDALSALCGEADGQQAAVDYDSYGAVITCLPNDHAQAACDGQAVVKVTATDIQVLISDYHCQF